MNLRFEIGDKVWWARPQSEATTVECPDCGGTGRIRVILHDEEEVSVDCQNCSRGYEPPTGRIPCYDRSPAAELVTINGFDFRDGKVEWGTTGSYRIEDDMLFENEADAIAHCVGIAERQDAADRDRIFKKEKNTRSWAWNATYHRKCIKDAKRSLEYHTAKLNAANLKVKDDKGSKVDGQTRDATTQGDEHRARP